MPDHQRSPALGDAEGGLDHSVLHPSGSGIGLQNGEGAGAADGR
jgi:hypothetical protein